MDPLQTPNEPSTPVPLAEGTPYSAHVPALDGVRGLAVLGVMASHLLTGNPHGMFSQLVLQGAAFGATGVDLFFVLSGFLITGILYDSLNDEHFFKKFYARRTLRIFPLYYGVVAAFFLANLFLHEGWGRQLLALMLYLQNTNLIAPRISTAGTSLPLGHLWSLALEEQFYLVWPLIVFLLAKRKRVFWMCVAGALSSVVLRWLLGSHGVNPRVLHETTALRLDTFLSGGALAMLIRGKQRAWVLRWGGLCFLVSVAATVILIHFGHGPVRLQVTLWYFGLAVSMMGLVAWSLSPGGIAEKVFKAPLLRTLGKYSYGLYVYHMTLFILCDRLLREWMLEHVTANKGVVIALDAVLLGSLSFAVAYGSYQLYEKPFLKLKRFFDYRGRGDLPNQS